MNSRSSTFPALDKPSRPFLVDDRSVMCATEFASIVRATAAQIDAMTAPGSPLLALCRTRGNFIAALCAALDRGRMVLLPHDDTPNSRNSLAKQYDRLAALADGKVTGFAGEIIDVSRSQATGSAGALAVPDTDEPLLQFFTSGSTGTPTLHARSWSALARGGPVWASFVGLDEQGGSVVATVPPQHMYGMEVSVVMPLTCPGVTVWNGQPLYPAEICRALEATRNRRVLATTPVHLNMLARSAIKLPQLHCIVSATAPLTVELARQAEALWQAPVFDVYGSTETGMIATRRPARSDVWKIRPDVTLTFGPEATVAQGQHLPGPIRLSDQLEPMDGGFRLQRRSDDLVNVAGKRASLSELNSVLQRLPNVLDAALWVPDDDDPTRFERPIAFVVSDRFDAESIRHNLRGRIADVFIPRQVISVTALPRDANGKLTRSALEAFKQAHTGQFFDDD